MSLQSSRDKRLGAAYHGCSGVLVCVRFDVLSDKCADEYFKFTVISGETPRPRGALLLYILGKIKVRERLLFEPFVFCEIHTRAVSRP